MVSESADKVSVLQVVPTELSTIYNGSNSSLQSKSADMLGVNCSSEETICASGRFWLELIYSHVSAVNINLSLFIFMFVSLYICLFYTYITVTNEY